MTSTDPAVPARSVAGYRAQGAPAIARDIETDAWVQGLTSDGAAREATVSRLYEMLLRVSRSEARRRSGSLGMTGVELDDIAHQAAADAVLAVCRKVGEFRGESLFTTWAYKFAVFEVSNKMTRHAWRRPTQAMEAEDWERLPARFGAETADEPEWQDLVAAVHRAVDEALTERQRRAFVAIVLNGVPLDVVIAEWGTNRNAVYKTIFDARGKLRAALIANGYLDPSADHDPTGRS